MADYTINIQFDDNDAGRKLDDLDKKVSKVAKEHKVEIKFPDLDKTKRNLQEVGKYAGLAAIAFKNFTPVGKQFTEIEGNVKVVGAGLANVGRTLAGMSVYLNPIRGMSDGFSAVASSIENVIGNTARLGFAIFGVTQSVNVLKAAFGQMFDDTVGREIRLRETLLQTATTIAGTNRVFLKGVEIEDPSQKLQALEGSVTASIERIRERSLEIAGTTSEAVISTFNVVAAQIGSFGGTLRQAEDLAVKFSGALGTLGMSNPMYARQEIGSIMMGYVDQNSVLAKTIGITNADIVKAKQTGQLVEFLSKKLEVFEAGQKKAAKGFSGITSNIQELQEELKRSFGSQLLDPILKRIGNFYDGISGKNTLKELMQTSRAFGQLIGGTMNTAFGTVANAPVFKGLDSEGLTKAADKLQTIFANVAIYIQEQLARIGPSVQRIVDNVVKSVAVFGRAFAELGAKLAQLKFDQIRIQLQVFSQLTNVVLAAVSAYSKYLELVGQIISTPLGRYINELSATFKILNDVGVFGILGFLTAVKALWKLIPEVAAGIQSVAAAIGNGFAAALSRVNGAMVGITGVVVKTVTAAITAVTVGVLRILALISTLAGRVEIALTTISTKLALGGGVLTKLAGPIYAVAKAFGQISVAAERAEVAVADLGIKGTIAMQRLQTGAQGAAAQVNGLGASLRSGVTQGARTAGTAIVGFGLSILKGIASMALWTIAITAVLDGLRRLSEWWDDFSQEQKYTQSLDSLNNGFLDQVQAARAAGRELDAVTAARQRLIQTDLETKLQKEIAALFKLEEELKKREKNIAAFRNAKGMPKLDRPDPDKNLTNQQLVLKNDPEFAKQLAERKRLIKEAEDALNKLLGKDPKSDEDPTLRAQENKQQIQDLANFEKEARRSIEDEVYNYRRQAQDKELQNWRQAGDLRIQQIDMGNRALIEGVDSEARTSLEALNNWIITKERGELDIEAKKKEAQLAAADLERAIGRFRMNLEKQVAEIRKRINQYEIEVLDKRIQAEQLIANIRNGAIQWEAQSATAPGGAGGIGDPTNSDVIVRAVKATENLTGIQNQCAEAVKRFMTVLGINSNVMDKSALSAQRMGRVMTDWSKLQPGDIVARGRIGDPEHVGVFTGGSNVFHQSRGRGLKTGNYPDLGYFRESGFFIRPYDAPQFTGNALPPEVRALLDTIAYAEGTAESGYGTMFAGGRFDFSKGHPDRAVSAGGYTSTAAGRYQFLTPTWQEWSRKAGVNPNSMSPVNQDQVAWTLASQRRGVDLQELKSQGLTVNIMNKLAPEWASIPLANGRSRYNQPVKTHSELKNYYQSRLQVQRGAGSSPAPGNASLASVGGAPVKPEITLQLDTAELDAAGARLKTATEEAIKMAEQSNDLTNKENFDKFVRSLNTTRPELERTTKELRNQQIELEAIGKATENGIYDPKVLEIAIRHQQNLTQVEALRATQLDVIKKKTFSSEADRAAAIKAVQDNYKNEVKSLEKIRDNAKALLNIEKQRELLTRLNQERRERELNFEKEQAQLRSRAREELFDQNNPMQSRMEAAELLIEERRLEYTNNNKEPMSKILEASFERDAADIRKRAAENAKLDQVIIQNRKLRELENDVLQQRIDKIRNELTVRTDAAKEALDPGNYQGRRRLDAERSVYEKYLDMSRGGVDPLDDEQKAKLQKFAEQTLTTADKMAVLDKEMENFAIRLNLARESAQTFVSSYKQMVGNVLAGGDIKEAVSEMTQNISQFFTGKILDYAFKPLEQQMESLFRNLFGVDEPQERNTNALKELTEVIRSWKPGDQTTNPTGAPVAPTTAAPEAAAEAAKTAEATGQVTESTTKLGEGIKKTATTTADATSQTLTNLQKYTSGLAAVGGFALGIAGGFANIQKGGTYNVLSGLSSIFGSLGGALGMFTPKGLFGGARALGGPVSARVPYLVGEKGPELFIPEAGGQVMSTANTQSMFQRTREALQAQQRPTQQVPTPPPSTWNRPIDVRYESQVINNVEYVTVDQHRKGMEQAARRGQLLAYQGMQNSVKVRRRLAI